MIEIGIIISYIIIYFLMYKKMVNIIIITINQLNKFLICKANIIIDNHITLNLEYIIVEMGISRYCFNI